MEASQRRWKKENESCRKNSCSIRIYWIDEKFSDHIDRVRSQHREIKTMTENIPENEIIVQMDFGEHYTRKSLAEVECLLKPNSSYLTSNSCLLPWPIKHSRTQKHRDYIWWTFTFNKYSLHFFWILWFRLWKSSTHIPFTFTTGLTVSLANTVANQCST